MKFEMTSPSLRSKQIANSKFKAEQYALLNKDGSKAQRKSVDRKNLGGRPPSGNAEYRIWIAKDQWAWVEIQAQAAGVTAGQVIESIIQSVRYGAEVQAAIKSK
jgi:hypothetical protein